jgi:hypothetical protein
MGYLKKKKKAMNWGRVMLEELGDYKKKKNTV